MADRSIASTKSKNIDSSFVWKFIQLSTVHLFGNLSSCLFQCFLQFITITLINEQYHRSNNFKREDVLIPCIPMIPNDMPFDFKRLQFPVRLAFAVSINKSQEQSLSVCGINLENPCFSHRQLYVTFPVLENHQHYLFSHQKTGLKLLFIKKR